MVFLFSHTLTRPLGALVEGVRALGRGDYNYPLAARGTDEVAEVTEAFVRMRQGLQETQRQLLDAERLATIGRMAAVVDLGRLKFSGLLAWWFWLAAHIFFLIGFRNRIGVFMKWTWTYLTLRDGVRLITGSQNLPGWKDRVPEPEAEIATKR